jgi:type IV pilus assembly protein PilN
MIRVNLLPIKQARRRSAGRTQLLVFGGLIALEVLVVLLLWGIAQSDLDRVEKQVQQYKAEVKAAKAEVKDAKQLEEQKEQLTKQLSVLDQLEAQRSGPVRVLDEFQAIMSPPRNEEDRFAQLQKNWNVDWDPRRLWVEKLTENDGSFTMEGEAVNADDVAEFLQRLTTADHFQNVQLEVVQATKASGSAGEAPVVSFRINGEISYAGKANKKAEEGS